MPTCGSVPVSLLEGEKSADCSRVRVRAAAIERGGVVAAFKGGGSGRGERPRAKSNLGGGMGGAGCVVRCGLRQLIAAADCGNTLGVRGVAAVLKQRC